MFYISAEYVYQIYIVLNLFQIALIPSMVMIVKKGAASLVKTICVIRMEYARVALMVTMDPIVIPVQITALMGVIQVENVMDVSLVIGAIIVVTHAQSFVIISVVGTLGTVRVAKLDTIDLSVDLHVLKIVMEVVIKVLVIVIHVHVVTGGINVKTNAPYTAKMAATKVMDTVIVTLDTGGIHVN